MDAHQTRLYFHLQRTAAELKMVADRELVKAAGITTSQAAALAAIKGQGKVKQNVLASVLEQNEAAVTQMVSRLESRGLLIRQRSAADQRAWNVEITQKGSDALSKAEPVFARINARLDTALGAKQRDLVDQLLAIRRSLQSL